jgi:membrane associated rhomboid family serine protease
MKNYLLKQSLQSLFYPLLFVAAMWLVFLLQNTSDFNFTSLGVLPREFKGLPGILTSVFVHGDIGHIASNTLPLLALGMMLFYFYKKIAKAAFLWIWIVSGIWLWIGGRNGIDHPTYHIGASTLIYGLATFLFFSGVFRRHLRLMVVSALVVFLYGSIMWGIFPFKTEISWEGHLFGALAGVLVAFNYRHEGPKPRVYQWEEEEEEEEGPQPWQEGSLEGENKTPDKPADEIRITYIYKEKEKE